MATRTEIALGDYDHVRDLVSGAVAGAPADVEWVCPESPEEIFGRFLGGEWDGAELSLAVHSARISRGVDDLVGVPVFPARSFRHAAIFVRSEARIEAPGDLTARRVGVPVWAQTAGVWVRGMLGRDYGVRLDSVDWHLAGVDSPGREEPTEIDPPAAISLTRHPQASLNELLLAGEIDAAISARPPRCFVEGHSEVRRLFADPRAAEAAWFRQHRIFPIMHLLVLRRAVVEARPELPAALCKGFAAAKARSLVRLAEETVPRLPLPWPAASLAEARELLGPDPWPYGLEANRETLAVFLEYALEQGVCRTAVEPERLFA